MNWEDGLRVNPGVLQARAARLLHTKAQLDAQIDQHQAIDVGPWRGEAQRARHSAHRRMLSDLRSHARRLPPTASALQDAARSFESIQRAQYNLIDSAARWDYAIQPSGWLRSTASGWAQLDPRRPFMRVRIQASVFSLVLRLNTTDIALKLKLWAADKVANVLDFLDDVRDGAMDLLSTVADGFLTGVEWIGGKIRDGLEWVGDRIRDAYEWGKELIESLPSRLEHAKTALDRFLETAATKPQWLTDLLEHGEIPQVSEVLGQTAFLAGQLFGVPLNFLTDDDKHLFDDGRPYLAGPDEVVPYSPAGGGQPFQMNGVPSIIDPMMDVYNTHDANDHTDRPQVQVTAVVDPVTGEVRYVASIPGTTEGMGSLEGWAGNPAGTDWAANLKGVGYGDTAATQSVMHAIELAIEQDMAARGLPLDGNRPEVLLTGHSQGGIIAGNIANDPGFAQRFDVGGVVSAGSPVDTLGIPSDIPVYNYQNQLDPVPRVDFGGAPTGTPDNVTNIVFDHSGSVSPTHTHAQTTYQDNIQELSNGTGSAENLAKQQRLNDDLARFYNGEATAYRVTYGRETD